MTAAQRVPDNRGIGTKATRSPALAPLRVAGAGVPDQHNLQPLHHLPLLLRASKGLGKSSLIYGSVFGHEPARTWELAYIFLLV